MSLSSQKIALCVRCRSEFTAEQIERTKACPTCGNTGVPADPRKKQTLTLTDHEWRIVFMWAGRWAEQCDKNGKATACMEAIVREVKRQAPTMPVLTLREEIQSVADALGSDVTFESGGKTEDIKPVKKH